MATLAQATQARDTSRLTPVASPSLAPFPPIPTPDAQQYSRNAFLVSPHPLVPTVDSLRQFYQNYLPQQRIVLPPSPGGASPPGPYAGDSVAANAGVIVGALYFQPGGSVVVRQS